MIAAVVRWRRVLLVTAVAFELALGLWGGDGLVTGLVNLAVVGFFFVLGLVALGRRRPAGLEVMDGAFAALITPQPMITGVAVTLLGVGLVYDDVADAFNGDLEVLNTVFAVVYLILLAVLGVVVWSPPRLRITPEGIADRRVLGSRFVPWEALDPASPITGKQLAVARPELVTTTGRPGSSYALETGTDPAFLARVISDYVAAPRTRAAIGTRAELNRLKVG
ncbi:PH domain-containing protein [Actinoplanes sp. NPDC049596]|uniref:PH domain-containing protein n=1 Tax=unclassified Actinoplanes TaxID=2626549 RepID=UPI003434B7E5